MKEGKEMMMWRSCRTYIKKEERLDEFEFQTFSCHFTLFLDHGFPIHLRTWILLRRGEIETCSCKFTSISSLICAIS